MTLSTFNFKLLSLSALVLVIEFTIRGLGEIYVPLHWTPLNPKFQPSSNTINSTTYLKMNVLPMSKLNIICPNNVLNPVKLQRSPAKDHLFENLWIVDKKSFDSCEVNTSIPSNRLLYQCNEPLKLRYYLLVFLDVSPSVKSLEFVRGKDYYFISTSDGTKNTLQSTKNGHCLTHRMKMILHVCRNEQDALCKEKTVTTPKPTYPTTTTTTIPTTTSPPTTTTATTLASTATTKATTEKKVVTQNDNVVAADDDNDERNGDGQVRTTEKEPEYPTPPKMDASKGRRTAAEIAEDATWFILVAVMGALLAVSVSCNMYILCCRRDHRRSEVDDKRSSAAHTLLRENSKVDRV